jgi:hypothetical protein
MKRLTRLSTFAVHVPREAEVPTIPASCQPETVLGKFRAQARGGECGLGDRKG